MLKHSEVTLESVWLKAQVARAEVQLGVSQPGVEPRSPAQYSPAADVPWATGQCCHSVTCSSCTDGPLLQTVQFQGRIGGWYCAPVAAGGNTKHNGTRYSVNCILKNTKP